MSFASRGHRVVFVIEESFAGTLEEKGFEERLMRLAPAPEHEEEPGQFWKDFIRDTAPVFRKSTFEQLEEFIAPTWQALIDGARYVDERLVEIFDELEPDAIVEDNVCAFPADPGQRPALGANRLLQPAGDQGSRSSPRPSRGCRWRPLGVGRLRRRVPAGDRGHHAEFSEFCAERGAPPLPEGELIHESPWLNLYLYPRELDYPRSRAPRPDLAQPRVERSHHRPAVDPAARAR